MDLITYRIKKWLKSFLYAVKAVSYLFLLDQDRLIIDLLANKVGLVIKASTREKRNKFANPRRVPDAIEVRRILPYWD